MTRRITILLYLIAFAPIAWSQTGNTQTTKTTTEKSATEKSSTTKPAVTKPAATKPANTKPAATKTTTAQPAATKPQSSGTKTTNQQGTQTKSGSNQINEVQITRPQTKKPQDVKPKGTETTGAKTQPGKTQTTTTQGANIQNQKSQTEEVKPAQQQIVDVNDTIILISGKKLLGKIQSISQTKVSYYPQTNKTKLELLALKQVHKVLYMSGKVENFNKPAFEMVSAGDFKTIVLTENSEEVEGLFPLEEIDAQSSKGSRNAKAAERSADIRIQKKAAALGGIMVLITRRESKGGYGEVPTHFVKGVVYGLEPPKEQPKK
ncbi:MAG: hypothetical protein AB9846_03290 [Tenuifilaceae bacterium]